MQDSVTLSSASLGKCSVKRALNILALKDDTLNLYEAFKGIFKRGAWLFENRAGGEEHGHSHFKFI